MLVDGNIVWVGTEPGSGKRGLVRFDDAGTPDNRQDDEWTPYDSLSGLAVQCLGLSGGLGQTVDTLWIGTTSGLYRAIRNSSPPYLFSWQRHLWWYNVTGLAFEPGLVWASTDGNGVFRWDGANWVQLNNGLPSLNVGGLALSGGQFWAATANGMALYDSPGSRWVVHNEGLTTYTMRRVALDRNGRAWAGGSQTGLWFWNGAQWQKIHLNQISYEWIDHLDLGVNGAVLVSHGYNGTGASLLFQGNWDTLRIPLSKPGSDWVAGVLASDNVDGSTWLGTWGVGLFRRRPSGVWDWYTKANTNNGLRTDYIAEMTQDPQGNHYLGCWWEAVSQFLPDRRTWTSYFYSGIPRMPFRSLLVDRRGRVWCGMDDQGLAVYDHGSWAYYYTGSVPSIPSDHVSDIAEDDSGNIWLATWGGVTYFDGRSFTTYTKSYTSGGLPSDQAEAVAIDSQGWIWVGTVGGLAVFDPLRKRWASYFQGSKGLVYNGIRKLRIRSDPQDPHRDQIWIGTAKGLSLFVPDNPPPTNLSSVLVYPNPYRPSAGPVTFQGLPDNSEIWVYTSSGDLVRHLASPNLHRGSLTWDGRNASGKSVAGGFYLYLVKGGGQSRGGTIAVLR